MESAAPTSHLLETTPVASVDASCVATPVLTCLSQGYTGIAPNLDLQLTAPAPSIAATARLAQLSARMEVDSMEL